MKILVTGARDIAPDVACIMIWAALGASRLELSEVDVFIVGDCLTGIDAYVRDAYPDKCEVYKGGGTRVNTEMIEDGNPDICLAFPSRNSNSAIDCLLKAIKHGVATYVFPVIE